MKKAVRSVLAVLLCVALMLPITANAAGSITNEDHIAVVELLRSVEPAKSSFGIDHVDFTAVKIGNKIHCYEYANNDFSEIRAAYPLFYDSVLFGLALQTDIGSFQFTVAFVDDIISLNATHIALIYDSTACYLYDGSAFVYLQKNPYEIETRDALPIDVRDLNTDYIVLCNLSQSTSLSYSCTINSRSSVEAFCGVSYVPQGDYKICWAATMACIVNYLLDYDLEAIDVAQAYYGETDFDRGLHPYYVRNFMHTYYGINYTYREETPSGSVVLQNIINDYPIYCAFSGDRGTHGVTIYGINRVSNIIYIMEPNNGPITGQWSNGVWTFVWPGTSETWTSYAALCYSW